MFEHYGIILAHIGILIGHSYVDYVIEFHRICNIVIFGLASHMASSALGFIRYLDIHAYLFKNNTYGYFCNYWYDRNIG
jgi:hypothetical protein